MDQHSLPDADTVIVLIEQTRNKHSKQFGMDLGNLMQQHVMDESKCVVRLSQPNLFRVGGAVEQTVQELNLVTLECTRKRTRRHLQLQLPAMIDWHQLLQAETT